MKTYQFEGLHGLKFEASGFDDAMSAFIAIKKRHLDNYSKLKRYIRSKQLPPEGYSLLDIGYGLSVAYRIEHESEETP